MLSEKDKRTLNAIPLTDVMAANGYQPAHVSKTQGWVKYLCPWHDDHDPSLQVDVSLHKGRADLRWKCYRCNLYGYGAISLQAALLGFPHDTELTAEQYNKVIGKLTDDHDVQLEGIPNESKECRNERLSLTEADAIVEHWTNEETADVLNSGGAYALRGDWTSGHFKALGFEVKIESDSLYRCSIDPDYYKGKGEARTLQQWGTMLQEQFSCYPVAEFLTKPFEPEQGGKCVLHIFSRYGCPVFVFLYPWGIKKYEPKNGRGNKWYWAREEGDDERLAPHLYGQQQVVATLTNTAKDAPPPVQTDKQHPVVVTQKDKDGTPLKARFGRLVLCSGPRDAMHIWAHTDAYVMWLNSETAGVGEDGMVEDWMRALLRRMVQVSVETFVCYDIDRTGEMASSALALENPQVRWVRLPKELGLIPAGKTQGIPRKSLNDVTDYVTHFKQVQARLAPDLRKGSPAVALDRLLRAALPMQFWIDKPTTKKNKDGDREANVRYQLAVANLLQFLYAKGIRCDVDSKGNRIFYQLNHEGIYAYLDTARQNNQLEAAARTAMLYWIDAHVENIEEQFKTNLVNTVFTGKGLDAKVLGTMPASPLHDHSWGEDFDHFFFANCAVKVTKDDIRPVAYSTLQWQTNQECILPGDFSVIEQPWRITMNPKYEEERQRHDDISRRCKTVEMRAAENRRWTQWSQLWKYKLQMDRPLEEMPLHFRFIYNTGRIFWEKESLGEKLTATERQMQDMHFINKVHAIGYAITRQRSRARQQIVHLTDYAVSDERKATGRNGKSAIIDMLGAVRPSSANVAGKSINGSNITLAVLLGEVVAGVHSLVGIDELPEGFKATELYNAPTQLVCKTLYRQPVTLRDDEVPKIFISSNKPFDRSEGSTKGRIYPCYNSDYYHAATDDGRMLDFTPADEFREQYGISEVANGLPPALLNELRNFLLACAQFFFQQPEDTIVPPTETRSLRRELFAVTKDAQLVDWLMEYFEDTPDNDHFNLPIAPQEMAISLLDATEETINYSNIEAAKKRISKHLKTCLARMGVVMDPPVVMRSATDRRQKASRRTVWLTPLDADGHPMEVEAKDRWGRKHKTGERLPRVLEKAVYAHYFYRNSPGQVPEKEEEVRECGEN